MSSSNPLAADLDHIISHTRDLWEEVRGQRIFITGGTGFFGVWLLESFIWANDRFGLNATATVLTRNLAAFQRRAPHLAVHPALKFHVGDVRNFAPPPGVFSHLVHAATAASATLNADDPLLMFDTIVVGTRQVLEFARQCGAQKFLLTSSGAVYGRQPPDLTHIPEDYRGAPDPLEPRSAYGEGKRAAELLCATYAQQYGLQTKIARCFAFVGPYLPVDIHYAIGNFIRDGLQGGPILVNGDGTPYRSYLYAADLMIWLWTILFRGQTSRPYNVGSGEALTIRELANRVGHAFSPAVEVHIAQAVQPGRLPERYVPAVARAVQELGLHNWIDFADGIRRTIAWHRLSV